MTVEYNDLGELVDEQVLVKLTGEDKVVGTLRTYKEDFGLTLTGTGQPDDVQIRDLNIDYVDGELILNGSNVVSVEQWERP